MLRWAVNTLTMKTERIPWWSRIDFSHSFFGIQFGTIAQVSSHGDTLKSHFGSVNSNSGFEIIIQMHEVPVSWWRVAYRLRTRNPFHLNIFSSRRSAAAVAQSWARLNFQQLYCEKRWRKCSRMERKTRETETYDKKKVIIITNPALLATSRLWRL